MKSEQRTPLFRKTALELAGLLIVFTITAFSQAVIENPDRPMSKTAGRTIALKEVLKITDESGEFFFKSPRIADQGPDGSIYVLDNQQILQFDKNGKFVRNYFKKGQGPGEMTYALGVFPTSRGLCVQATQKLVWFDDAGNLLKEVLIPRPGRASFRLLGILNDVFYFLTYEFRRITGEPQYVDDLYSIASWKEGGGEPDDLMAFPVKTYAVSGGGMTIAPFMAVPFGSKAFAVVHTCEYFLKMFDIEKKAKVWTMTRAYKRVESPPQTEEDKKPTLTINNKAFFPPRQRYLNDISNVIARGDKIWVITSTQDAKRGTLIDVFDVAGKYVDAFYLNIPSANYAVFGDSLYAAEKNSDETYAIKKYRIEWRD